MDGFFGLLLRDTDWVTLVFWLGAYILFFVHVGAMHYEETTVNGKKQVVVLGFLNFLRMMWGSYEYPYDAKWHKTIHRRPIISIAMNYLTLMAGLWMVFYMVEFSFYLAFIILAPLVRVAMGYTVKDGLIVGIKNMMAEDRCMTITYALDAAIQIAICGGYYGLIVFLNKP